MAQGEAARQLFDSVKVLFEALYWPGDNTGYVHTDTIDLLGDAMVDLADAYMWDIGPDVAAYRVGRYAARDKEAGA